MAHKKWTATGSTSFIFQSWFSPHTPNLNLFSFFLTYRSQTRSHIKTNLGERFKAGSPSPSIHNTLTPPPSPTVLSYTWQPLEEESHRGKENMWTWETVWLKSYCSAIFFLYSFLPHYDWTTLCCWWEDWDGAQNSQSRWEHPWFTTHSKGIWPRDFFFISYTGHRLQHKTIGILEITASLANSACIFKRHFTMEIRGKWPPPIRRENLFYFNWACY